MKRRRIGFAGTLAATVLMIGPVRAALLVHESFEASNTSDYTNGVYLDQADIVDLAGNATCTGGSIVGFDETEAWDAYDTGYSFDAYSGALKLVARSSSQDYVGRRHVVEMGGKSRVYARIGLKMSSGGGAANPDAFAIAGFSANASLGSPGGAAVGYKWDSTNSRWYLVLRYNNGSVDIATILADAAYDTVYNIYWLMDDANDTIKVWLTEGVGVAADSTDTPDLVATDWTGGSVGAITHLSVGFSYTGTSDVYVYDARLGDNAEDVGMIGPPAPGFIFLLRGLPKRPDADVFVAPTARGTGLGSDAENAAAYTNSAFWGEVQDLLISAPVVVSMLDGNYRNWFNLVLIGDEENTLTLIGESPAGVTFDGTLTTLLGLRGCQNITLENLNFTGAGTGYALRITKADDGTPSKNITVRNCNWYDMESLYYGATGVHYGSHDVTYENCTFKRIGHDSHAHMMYNAYNAVHVSVFNCLFEDCSGSYVRFRAASDYGVVSGCIFVSTQTYANKHASWEVFLDFPAFNDVDPGDETFSQYATITNNVFRFNSASPPKRTGVRFYHSGYDPPGWHYLMTESEGRILKSGSGTEKEELLRNNCGIDFDETLLQGNNWQNETYRIVFGSYAEYGAVSKGWDDIADVSDIVFGL